MTNYQLQIKSFVFGPFETNCYVVTINDQSPGASSRRNGKSGLRLEGLSPIPNPQSPMVLLVDPACSNEYEQQQLLTYIENQKSKIKNLQLSIVATHGHLDHLWGAAWACAKWNTPVLMHEADIPMAKAMQQQYDLFGIRAKAQPFPIEDIKSKIKNHKFEKIVPFKGKEITNDKLPGASSRQTGGAASAEKGYYQSPITNHQSPIPPFRGEQGGRILSTPGHTPGSICLYFPEDKVLFSGDTLFKMGYGRTDLPGGNFSQLIDSLVRLFALPSDVQVFPGHGEPTTIGAEARWIVRERGMEEVNANRNIEGRS